MQIKFLQEYNVHKAWRRLTERLLCWTITGAPERGPSPEGRGVSVTVSATHTSRQRAMGNGPPSPTLTLRRFRPSASLTAFLCSAVSLKSIVFYDTLTKFLSPPLTITGTQLIFQTQR